MPRFAPGCRPARDRRASGCPRGSSSAATLAEALDRLRRRGSTDMEAFSAEWLALARAGGPRGPRGRGWSRWPWTRWPRAPSVVTVVDLAAGTGSNLRYLTRRLPFASALDAGGSRPTACWTRPPATGELAGDVSADGVTSTARSIWRRWDDSRAHGRGRRAPQAPLLVTASALLDLTSRRVAGRTGGALSRAARRGALRAHLRRPDRL